MNFGLGLVLCLLGSFVIARVNYPEHLVRALAESVMYGAVLGTISAYYKVKESRKN